MFTEALFMIANRGGNTIFVSGNGKISSVQTMSTKSEAELTSWT